MISLLSEKVKLICIQQMQIIKTYPILIIGLIYKKIRLTFIDLICNIFITFRKSNLFKNWYII